MIRITIRPSACWGQTFWSTADFVCHQQPAETIVQ